MTHGCPRCSGATYADQDQYGWRIVCRNCGWDKDLTPISEPPPTPKRHSHGGRPAQEKYIPWTDTDFDFLRDARAKGYTYQEIGEAMGWTAESVRSMWQRQQGRSETSPSGIPWK